MDKSRLSTRSALIAGVATYVIWGVFPLYFPLLDRASVLEVLGERILFCFVLMVIVMFLTGGWPTVLTIWQDRRKRLMLAGAAALIATNWATYIWAVNAHHVVESSLGYFVNPLFTVLLGVVLLGERLRRAQWWAIGVAAAAVIILSVDSGRPPWIALALAGTFGFYGFLKKQADASAAEGLTIESAVLTLPSIVLLTVIAVNGDLAFAAHGPGLTLLLLSAGPATAIPLLLFAQASRVLPLTIIGLLQYITPVLQFGIGVLVRHEPMPPGRLAGFALVWVALIMLTFDGVRHNRQAAALARSAESVTT